VVGAAGLVFGVLLTLTEGPFGSAQGPVVATLSVAEALSGGNLEGFARAEAPRDFVFPRDHGPHPEFRAEWWYWTGNLRTTGGRHLGFQLTFFRSALTPDASARESDWGATQAYLAHLAVTDSRGGRFHFVTRTSREALGLAGAQAEPFRVFVEDWEARSEGPATFPLRLRAADEAMALDLRLENTKPPVLQGERGLSRKGPEPGNASYYYSLTRLTARGTVRLGTEMLEVEGLAWMDREWSTAAVGQDLAGWDWFALQLEDGRELMYYRLRRRDGTADPFSAGVVVDARGGTRALARDDLRLEVTGTWRSHRSDVAYPAGWRLTDLAGGLELTVTPLLADQELDVSPRYWEGAVEVRGTDGGLPVAGHGYVELVGYGVAGRRSPAKR
jgi:predicted secreted hydrolase